MKYFIIAGEASGDLHASNLMRELKKKDANADFCFLGGDLMQKQGGLMVKHYRQMAFMGFLNVLLNARTVLQNLRDCKNAILNYKPDVVILVDYPSFNLRIARFVKEELTAIPVYYYISPKIWAWKEYRIKQIKKYIDKMFTIFPFETEFYARHNYQVDYVGNPTVDSISEFSPRFDSLTAFCKHNKLDEKPIVAILAGSRKQEIKHCLERMISAAVSFEEYQIVVAGAPGIDKAFYYSTLPKVNFQIVFDQTYELLSHAHIAIVNSGTATLETALFNVPEVVVYHVAMGRLAGWLKDILIKVKYISLVNLIADKEVVKELVAHNFTENNIKGELPRMLFDEDFRKEMMNDYALVKERLGEPGAANHAAEKILFYLKNV